MPRKQPGLGNLGGSTGGGDVGASASRDDASAQAANSKNEADRDAVKAQLQKALLDSTQTKSKGGGSADKAPPAPCKCEAGDPLCACLGADDDTLTAESNARLSDHQSEMKSCLKEGTSLEVKLVVTDHKARFELPASASDEVKACFAKIAAKLELKHAGNATVSAKVSR
jgi:hypothetical protein